VLDWISATFILICMGFIEELEEKILIADGAMGTLIYAKGVPKGHCYDELNISAPELIAEIHREYIEAGARIIETNTFGANRYILERYYDLGKRTREINLMGAKIAKEAAKGKGVYVAGSVGPVTRVWESEPSFSPSDLRSIFKESISALLDGGVDLIILETFTSLEELVIGYKTALELAGEDFPVIASLSFLAEGRTLMGVEPAQFAHEFQRLSANLIGANCGTGPKPLLDTVRRIGKIFSGFISAMPNAGFPNFSDGRFVYPATPEYFASFAVRAARSGVNIIGGCCGTTPEHIRAMSRAIEKVRPVKRKIITFYEGKFPKPITVPRPLPPFVAKLKEGFIFSVEIDPPKGSDVSKIIEQCNEFGSLGGSAVNVADLPMAKLRMSALSLAIILKRETKLDIILHITARDRNIIALQSDLLGAYANGVDIILALRGDPPSLGDYPFATGVFDLTSAGIVKLASAFNTGKDTLGNPIENVTNFSIGVAFNQNAQSIDSEFKRLEMKIRAGAHFIQTQPVFDPQTIDPLVEFARYRDIPVIATVMLLSSVAQAEYIANEVPGIKMPKSLIQRLQLAEDPEEESINFSIGLISELMGRVNGVCLVFPQGKFSLVRGLMTRI